MGQVVRLMTRQLYKCLDPAFNSKEQWESFTLLSSDAKVELDFWWEKIRKLNGFSIKPVLPSTTVCEIVARDTSADGHYVAKFSDKNKTLMSRKFSVFEQQQSSTYRECLVVLDLYTMSHLPVVKFKIQQIMHVTDNQGGAAIFNKGSPRDPLQSIAVKVYMAAVGCTNLLV